MAENKVTTVFTANTREFEAAVRKVTQEMGNAEKQTQSFSQKAKSGYAMAGIALAGFGAGILKLVQSASNLEETTSKFNTVFASTSKDMGAEVGNLTKNYAMSTREARGNLAAMQDLLVPMGMNADKAAGLSTEVVKLAADLGSFNNLPTSQVMADMQSALVGNFETMKKYGVVLNASTVEQQALSMGLAKTKDALTAADKAQAAFALIMKGSSAAVGDMIRTGDGYANTVKSMNAKMEDLTAGLGQAFMPVLKDIVKGISDVVSWFNSLDDDTKKLIATTAALIAGILVATKVIMAFGASFKAAFTASAILGGVIAIIAALSSLVKSTEQLQEEVAQTKQGFDNLAKQEKLLAALKNTKQGTEAYGKTIDQIQKLNPKLENSNLKTAGSYNEIAKRVNAAGNEQRKYLQSIAALQTQEVSSKLGAMLATLYVTGRASTRAQAEIATLNKTLAEAAVLSGGSANAQFGKLADMLKDLEAQGLLVGGSFQKLKGDFIAAAQSARGVGKDISDIPKTADVKVDVKTDAMKKASDDLKKLLEDYKKLTLDIGTEDAKRNAAMIEAANIRAQIVKSGLDTQQKVEQEYSQKRIADIMAAFGQEQAIQIAQMTQRLVMAGQQNLALELLNKAHQEAQVKLKAEADKRQIMLDKMKQQALLSGTQTMFGNLMAVAQAGGKKMFNFYKAMAVSQSIIAGIESGIEAWKHGMRAGGPPLAGVFLAASLAATGAQIAQISKQKPPAAEYGAIIPPSAQGTIIAGEKNKAEAIIPLEGEGADRLRAAGFGGGATVVVDMKGAVLAGDEIPEKIAQGIDKALYRLGLSNNSLVMARA